MTIKFQYKIGDVVASSTDPDIAQELLFWWRLRLPCAIIAHTVGPVDFEEDRRRFTVYEIIVKEG